MTILVIGGTGKSATPLVRLLHQANHPIVLANRSGTVPAPYTGTRFDWLDPSTYPLPFSTHPDIDRVYLVAPSLIDPYPQVKAFIDYARARGVRRFVVMSGSPLEKGQPPMGRVHEYLDGLGVEYCALRPSWFFDNFATQYADRIRTEDEIVSAAGDGKLGYVSTEDIADVAFKALVDDVIEHDNPIIVGPELVSYDQIADMLTEVLGRKITHRRLDEAELKQVMLGRGMPEEYAQMMVAIDGYVAGGGEGKQFERANVVGKRKIRDFFEANKDVWRKVD
ncbi:NAD(P)-binding protein [Favolaschia claudopus]|uniref:NAD(P)-binding protein n=1 Tax=Favolaschia claudopus TaxID=2862362 RepID=A0AAW0E9I7_9AGAR